MAVAPVSKSAIIWILVAVLVGAYAYWLSSQLEVAREQGRDAQQRERQLVEQLQVLAARPPVQVTQDGSGLPTEVIARALIRRPDLIPFEPVVGGTFYCLEDTVRVLSERHVLVACEDGHLRGNMLLSYRAGDDGSVSFRVLDAYLD